MSDARHPLKKYDCPLLFSISVIVRKPKNPIRVAATCFHAFPRNLWCSGNANVVELVGKEQLFERRKRRLKTGKEV